MRLSEKGLANKAAWKEKGYELPAFDRDAVKASTKENPIWIHFGAGNIFKAFQAKAVQKLLNEGTMDKGIIVAEGFDYEIIDKISRPYDDYHILVTLKADGTVEKSVVGSVVESLKLDSDDEKDFGRLCEIFRKESLQMCTFTITEKGYSLVGQEIQEDFINGPEKPQSYLGKVVSLLYKRYLAGAKPLAMVSTDNCSHNGDKLFEAVYTFADQWVENGKADVGFAEYVKDRNKVSFPWSMIDKITPRPDAYVEQILKKDGVEEIAPVITSKNTYVAPFVNAEEMEYLVIEDAFPNGRPPLEKAGILFTERDIVDNVEKMKVCTCLNPLHTCLAIFGCLLGYTKISDEMNDTELRKLVEIVGYQEGLPVVVNPGILDPKEFLDTVLNVRFPNPFMPDTPQRIVTDTSQKLAVRFGETMKAYQASSERKVSDLKRIPLVFAGWLRYLMGIDDNGTVFELSPDPLLDTLRPYLSEVKLGETVTEERIRPILEKTEIFGIDLYEIKMAEIVYQYFCEMIAGRGAVRTVLKKYVD